MTTVVTYRTKDKVYMLGDTRAEVRGQINIQVTKVFKHEGWLVGLAGSLDVGFEIIDKFLHIYTPKEIPHPPSWFAEQLKSSKDEDNDTSLILANKDKSYSVTGGGYYSIEEEFYSIGSGSPFAYGAWEMLKAWCLDDNNSIFPKLKTIMNICASRSPGTNDKCTFMELDINENI